MKNVVAIALVISELALLAIEFELPTAKLLDPGQLLVRPAWSYAAVVAPLMFVGAWLARRVIPWPGAATGAALVFMSFRAGTGLALDATGGVAIEPTLFFLPGAVLVDTVELKTHSSREVVRASEMLDRRFDTYMEVPVGDDPAELVATISGTHAKAKIRTGGVTSEAIPSSAQLLRFLLRCIENGVSFEESLMQNAAVKKAMSVVEVKAVLDPTTYAGRAGEIVDEVLAQQRKAGWID